MLRNPWVILGLFVTLLAVLVTAYSMGNSHGRKSVKADWDAAVAEQAKAVEDERADKQGKSDALDEAGMKQIQDTLAENERLRDQLDNDIKASDLSRYVTPDNIVRSYNAQVHPRKN